MNSFHYVLEKKLRVPNRNLLIEWLNKLFVIEYHLKLSYLVEKKKKLIINLFRSIDHEPFGTSSRQSGQNRDPLCKSDHIWRYLDTNGIIDRDSFLVFRRR